VYGTGFRNLLVLVIGTGLRVTPECLLDRFLPGHAEQYA